MANDLYNLGVPTSAFFMPSVVSLILILRKTGDGSAEPF